MKLKIKTNLWSGTTMGVFGTVMLFVMPDQVRLPMFDSGAPSSRTILGTCLAGTLICSVVPLVESLVFKREKETEFDWAEEKPYTFLTVLFCAFVALIVNTGFIPGVAIILPIMLWYYDERKPFIYTFTLVAGIGIFFPSKYVFYTSLSGVPGFGG